MTGFTKEELQIILFWGMHRVESIGVKNFHAEGHIEVFKKLQQMLMNHIFDPEQDPRPEYRCAFCDDRGIHEKWFSCPSTIWRPNMYTVCDAHKDMYLSWNDVYPAEQEKAVTRHEYKLKRTEN